MPLAGTCPEAKKRQDYVSFLQLHNLYKKFPDGTEAVKGIDLSIEEGEFIVLLGPSGCGKTTTLRMIAGLELPTSGTVFLDNEDVTRTRPARRDIGFVFQFYALYPHMTVYRNLSFPLENTGMVKQKRNRVIRETAEQMGIEELLDMYPGQLAGGDQQKVSVARAMIRYPKIWLMDEPLGTIDADKRIELREWIRQKQMSMGVTTVYVTHDQEEAMSLADRVVVMDEGLIDQVDTPKEVYCNPASVFTADFLGSPGMNLVEGKIAEGIFTALNGAEAFLQTGEYTGPAFLGARGEFIRADEQEGWIQGVVIHTEYMGALTTVHIDIGQEQPLVMIAKPRESHFPGEEICLSFEAEQIRIFNGTTGKALG